MVIVSATSYYPEQAREIMRQVSVDSLTPEQWEILKSRHIQGEEQIRHLYLQARNFAEESEDMNFSSEDLSKIKARTLIVQGDRDPLFPLDISIEMYKAIPNSALWIVPNGGHGPIFGDAADYFKKTAISYLKNELQN
jgi:pimeloyl-ACP methyl ester carboxylesterase